MAESPKTLIVGISGCSSSGKTTPARLLRDLFPEAFILHENDFYRPEEELPLRKGVIDWDCAEAIEIKKLADTLAYIRQHATLPDDKAAGQCPVPESTLTALRSKVTSALRSHPHLPRLCLLDGFLLYPPSMAAIHPSLDLKLFLRATYAAAKRRREAWPGYVTLEGFWTDPPGYLDDIVWPNYVREHAWMFQEGDVEGAYRENVLEEERIKVLNGTSVDTDLGEVLQWMVDTILSELTKAIERNAEQ